MGIQLQVGRYYLDRGGVSHGPMTLDPHNVMHPFQDRDCTWALDGRYDAYTDTESQLDLVAEVQAKDEVTLRDRIAMAALTGLVGSSREYCEYEILALEAYRIADVMLRARQLKS